VAEGTTEAVAGAAVGAEVVSEAAAAVMVQSATARSPRTMIWVLHKSDIKKLFGFP